MNSLFATTAQGLEELLKSELETLGAASCKIALGGVHFQADSRLLYRALLWSRLASRIVLPLNEFSVDSDGDLYRDVQAVNWPSLFTVDKRFAVHFSGTNAAIRNSQYGALKVKDTIVDIFTRHGARRPDVDRQQPDIRIQAYLHRDRVMLSLDLSGSSLHQRGYRDAAGQAPLKENLAAAIVLRSGWQTGTPLLDPMCGSGTLLIEAALIAADCAPGLTRPCWGFSAWSGHDEALWQETVHEARERARAGLAQTASRFYGSDVDSRVLEKARQNARRAGVSALITFQAGEVAQLVNPLQEGPRGTVVSNPPYGERLESEPALIALHNQLGRFMKSRFGGWRLSLFSASPALLGALMLRAERSFKAKNGPLDCEQKNYLLAETAVAPGQVEGQIAADFANRLRKNVRSLQKWVEREKLDGYRLYDADLPEYNVAIDRYSSWVVIQEYVAPKSVEPERARQRLYDVINATLAVLAIPASRLVVKAREWQKGKNQYEKLAQKGEFLLVEEYGAKLWVNLTDYLDTGLFLDHRIARRMLGEMSRGKDFLNLFAYTGTASVHAGIGGARSTTSVDMSRTFLEWAEKNLRSNDLVGRQHRLIQADCLAWLSMAQETFDVIFIDPPTFSNSKRMADTFDVQRDYLALMADTFDVQRDYLALMAELKQLLRPGGTIMFSNNRRGFQLDDAGLTALGLRAQPITDRTRSPDFTRNRQIHHCWLISHADKDLYAMSLISLSGAWLSFSDAPLLDNTELHIERNERVCLVGRNGAGKSTLMKILSREVPLDDGQLIFEQDVIVAQLQQDPPRDVTGSVFDFVAEGVEAQAQILKAYHGISQRVEQDPSEKNLAEMGRLMEILDHQNLWHLEKRIHEVIAQIGLDAESQLSSLSGGWLRKAVLGRALVCEPQVLLLDEPTNHLDIETIDWLDAFLKTFPGSIIFISHDRSFIREMATRIVDLDRGKLVSWPGNYDKYLEGKEEELRVQELQNAEFDRKLAQEEVWIRQGIKARRTCNEGRVRALKALRKARSERREVMGSAKIQVEEAARSGKIVFELEDVSYGIEGKPLISHFSAQVQRGDKIALIGPNGCGKTTLLKLMLGQLGADSGRIHCGTKLEVAYFDQYRAVLDPERTVMDNLAEGKQEVMVNGRSRHVLGYLQDFLFHPKRAMTPVKALSSGERNRLLLARLFLNPSNLLILDEPTNDLDVETLELLEELLDSYQGTVLLVSHDRQFVDNSVTECWIFEGEGRIECYVGGYFDAQRQRSNRRVLRAQPTPAQKTPAPAPGSTPSSAKRGGGKLSYNLQRELETLPGQIERLEQEIGQLQAQVAAPDFFSQPHETTQPVMTAIAQAEDALEQAFTRWETLEAQKNGAAE